MTLDWMPFLRYMWSNFWWSCNVHLWQSLSFGVFGFQTVLSWVSPWSFSAQVRTFGLQFFSIPIWRTENFCLPFFLTCNWIITKWSRSVCCGTTCSHTLRGQIGQGSVLPIILLPHIRFPPSPPVQVMAKMSVNKFSFYVDWVQLCNKTCLYWFTTN